MLKAMQRRGLSKPDWSTPDEFAASVRETPWGTLVGDFTQEYQSVRFGGAASTQRLRQLLGSLEMR